MKKRWKYFARGILFFSVLIFLSCSACAQERSNSGSLDSEVDIKVQSGLNDMRGKWRELNIPYSDGKILYDIIIENHYTRDLAIGPSPGHTAIWLAWAL